MPIHHKRFVGKDDYLLKWYDVSVRMHDDVRRICVDETSYRKGHKYITVVYDMDKNRVIWVHEDHGYDVLVDLI